MSVWSLVHLFLLRTSLGQTHFWSERTSFWDLVARGSQWGLPACHNISNAWPFLCGLNGGTCPSTCHTFTWFVKLSLHMKTLTIQALRAFPLWYQIANISSEMTSYQQYIFVLYISKACFKEARCIALFRYKWGLTQAFIRMPYGAFELWCQTSLHWP